MKKFLLVCAVLCFFKAQTSAQGFNSVHSSNGLDVWAVGNSGNVFHSLDAGATWSQTSAGTATLRSVFTLGNTVWMVGDEGKCFASTNGGANFIEEAPAGTTALTQILFLNQQTGWIAGANGLLLKTTDGGATWVQQTSGTTLRLTALIFTDLQNGFVGATGGTLLKTVDGGASWISVGGTTWTKDITGISVAGSTVYVTGIDAFSAKSLDGGTTWTALNLNTDSRSDVNGAFAKSSTEVFFVGGGGYIRKTTNGGTTFTYPQHGLHAPLNDIFFYDALRGWAVSEKNNVVLRTSDGGATWQMPQGTTVNAAWAQKLSVTATVRGDAFSINPFNKNTIYCALGNRVYASYNRGETWSNISGITGSKVSSFYVSPKDSNLWVAAVGSPDQIVRSTNHGQTWTATITKDFTEYGMPLEMDGSHPDTLIFGPEDGHLYRSVDFGATWSDLSTPNFRSPCDIVIVRDNPNIIWVGDGITGSGLGVMHRSRDAGRSFQVVYTTTGSEIPTVTNSGLDNAVGYATAWGSGGVMKTVDVGEAWTSVASTGSTWGVDIAKDDPNVIMYGVYGGATSYLSSSAGSAFTTSSLSGSNYAIYAYDRATFLAQQSGGIYKYSFTYLVPVSNQQALALVSPNGGESWPYGSVRNITWNASAIAAVKIEYKTSAVTPWQTIVASTAAGAGSYAWTVPNTPSSSARVRISDVSDNAPIDSSDNVFSITVAAISAQPNSVNFGSVTVGASGRQTIQLTNSGTAPLIVSSVSATNSGFIAGRGSFTIPAGGTDTLSILFSPAVAQPYNAQLQVNCNVPGSPYLIGVSGTGSPSAAVAVTAPNGGELWRQGTQHPITWMAFGLDRLELSYKISPTDSWRRIAQSVDASVGSYSWTVPNTPTTQGRVKVVDRATGSIIDSSDNVFTIDGSTSVASYSGIPTEFELLQNYPNPFNPSTTISYGIPHESQVSLKVFNMIGQEIATLVNERQSAGRYTIVFDTQKLTGIASSGLYLCRFSAGDFVEIRKMTLLK